MLAWRAHLDVEHQLVAPHAELGLEQHRELLLRDRLRPPAVRAFDPLQRLRRQEDAEQLTTLHRQ